MPCRGLAEYLPGRSVEGGIKRKGAVAKVFKPMALGTPGRKREHRIEAIQGLDGALFIQREDRGVGRRLMVEADDVGGLGFEIGVIAGHVATHPVRLNPGPLPDPGDHGVAHLEMTRQTPCAPVGGAIGGRHTCRRQDLTLQRWGAAQSFASTVAGIESGDAFGQKPSLPTRHILAPASQASLQGAVGLPSGEAENQIRPPGLIHTHAPRAGFGFELSSLRWAKSHMGFRHAARLQHNSLTFNDTVH